MILGHFFQDGSEVILYLRIVFLQKTVMVHRHLAGVLIDPGLFHIKSGILTFDDISVVFATLTEQKLGGNMEDTAICIKENQSMGKFLDTLKSSTFCEEILKRFFAIFLNVIGNESVGQKPGGIDVCGVIMFRGETKQISVQGILRTSVVLIAVQSLQRHAVEVAAQIIGVSVDGTEMTVFAKLAVKQSCYKFRGFPILQAGVDGVTISKCGVVCRRCINGNL